MPPAGGPGAGFDAEFLKNTLRMLFYRSFTPAENFADLCVALSRCNPSQHFRFTSGKGFERRDRDRLDGTDGEAAVRAVIAGVMEDGLY